MRMCTIENGKFAWIMRVDGIIVEFQGRDNAIYFIKHYAELGYDIQIVNDNKLLGEVIDRENGVFRVVTNLLESYTCMISNGTVMQWQMEEIAGDLAKGGWKPSTLSLGEVIRHVR